MQFDRQSQDFSAEEGRKADVVVIDDEESMCEACRQTLEEEGHKAIVAYNGLDGIELIKNSRPNVVLLDLKMRGMGGIEVLREIAKIDSQISVIIITGYGTIDSAVESMKIGAYDFLAKPVEPEKLLKTVARGIKLSELKRESGKAPGKGSDETAAVAPAFSQKQNILLKGLEVLGEFCALGEERQNFYSELKHLDAEIKFHEESLGRIKKKEKAILETVAQFRAVDSIIKKHNYKKSALIQIMLDIQNEIKWLPQHVINWVSARLNIPVADLYSLANFYEVLSLEPVGSHMVQICDGTACHVRGASELVERVSALLGIKPGETDAEQLFTLKTVHCLGCCALAPVVKIDDKYYSNPSMDTLKKIFKTYREKEETSCRN
jgi:NADH-quinone oxidoreductase subunit E